jgi:inorganic triphosphatase YgiF
MNNEVELKLLIAPAEIRQLQRHPLLKALTRQKLPTQRLFSVYYDTPELDLHKRNIAVRLRRVGRRWVQTVKAEGSVAAGLHERPEWENETTENTLDFTAITDPKLQKIFADKELRQTLRPVFITEFTRARRILEFPSGDVVEYSLDRGEVRAGDEHLPICEVELELKSGNTARLFEFALRLQETLPLKLENVSKAERGYKLATHATLAPVKAKAPQLEKELSANDAFLHIMQSCLVHLQANEEGVLCGEDPEFVHQLRVALRRMRSALSVFAELVPKEKTLSIREELRWLTKELDGARNWDVLALETMSPIYAAFLDSEGLAQLNSRIGEVRQQRDTQARSAVASPRYYKFLLDLGAWLCTAPWRDATGTEARASEPCIVDFAANVLQKRHKQLKKRGKSIASLSSPERHRVRIAAKKLRYAAEFFSSLYSRKRAREYIAALSTLQDVLGALNDTATTLTLLQELQVAEHDTSQQQAVEIIRSWVLGASQVRLKDVERVWQQFLEQKIFW